MMRKPLFLSRLVLRFSALAATSLAILSAPAQSVLPRVALPSLAPTALAYATDAGPLPASQPLTLTLTLGRTPARAAALDSFLTAQTTPSSASYHRWITPQQFADSYGATPDQIAAATVWAQAQGLTVAAISPAGTRLTVTGSAQQVGAALAIQLENYTQSGYTFYAPSTSPTLPADIAPLVTAIDGLTNLPADLQIYGTGPNNIPSTLVNGRPAVQDVPTLAALIDTNATPILSIDSTFGSATLTQPALDAYAVLFKQAAAQGITTLLARTASSGGFPSTLPEVTAIARAGDLPDQQTSSAARPAWQSAPGLPADALRHAPDLTTPSLTAFATALTDIAAGTRLGNINPVLYQLAPTPGLFDQAGTWQTTTGLGQLDLKKLAKVYPRGTGSSFTSFQATNYSPTHGQGTSFTSNVTSGTGGATPTGTVSFVTSAGTVLGTSPLTNGSGSITINTLDGGNYIVDAVYSGDGTYASSTSPTAQLYVGPEPSALTVAIGGNPTIGGSYTVTVTDTAPSGVGIPSGAITVTLSGTNSVYNANLTPAGSASSTATVTIPTTAAGTFTLSVQCTTTPNYSCYNPLTTTVTIAKATPVLSISYTPNPPVSGQSITLNAVVSTVGTAPPPTGAVTFFDNGTTLNASQLSNGATSTTGTVPTTATHSISATYAGDPNYLSVTTTAGSTTSGTIATTLILQSSASVVTAGQTITFTATLAAAMTGPAAPTGNVTFFDGSAMLGTANLANNVASFSTAGLSATVNHTISAVYSGDGYYTTSTSNAVGLSSNNTSNVTTTLLVVSPTNPVHGSTVTFTATVSGPAGGTVPTGTVTFTSAGSGTLGMATLVNGVATLTTNQLFGGTSSYTAAYSGSTTYNPSFSSAVSVTVTPEPVTLTITPPANAAFGSSFTVLVTVSGASGVQYPTGTVTVTPQGSGYSAASSAGVTSSGTGSTGSAAVVIQATGTGSVTFTASYTGDKNFAPAGPVSVNATIAKAVSTTTVSFNPTQPVAGQTTTISAHVAFASSIAPTGTVQFFDGTTLLGTATLGTNGTATLTTVFSAGNHVVTAAYSGDANYAASTSAPANTNPGTTPSTTTLTISPATVAAGATVSLVVNVGPTTGTAQPSGTVQIVSGTTVLCTTTVTAGLAGCSYTPATAGTLTLTANYLGDGNFAASSSAPVTLTVTGTTTGKIATTTVVLASAGGTAGTITLTATVTPASAFTPTLTGSVTFYDGTTPIGVALLVTGTTSGTAAVNVTLSATATHSITAVYSGDANYAASTSPAITGIITTTSKVTPVIVLTVTPTTGLSGSVVTLTATVAGVTPSGAAPTGTVTFYAVGGTGGVLGTATLGASGAGIGTAVLAIAIPAGTTSVYAVYAGDTNFTTVTSASVSFGQGTYDITFVPQSITLHPGQTGQATLVVTSVNGFAGTLTFACSPQADSGITCSISPTVATSAGNVILTVNTVAPMARGTQQAATRTGKILGGLSLAALLCFFLPAGRRRRIPAMLLVLLALALAGNLGCSDNSFTFTTPTGGTPLGTSILTITTATSDGVHVVRQQYPYQVTVQ